MLQQYSYNVQPVTARVSSLEMEATTIKENRMYSQAIARFTMRPEFFRASFPKLHKLVLFAVQNNFIHFFIYFLHGKDRTHRNDLAPNVWLHSSAVMVEHRTVFPEVTGSNPVEAMNFFPGFFSPIA